MNSTFEPRLLEVIAFLKELNSHNERFNGTALKFEGKVTYTHNGSLDVSIFIWHGVEIVKSYCGVNIQRDDRYEEYEAFVKEMRESILTKTAEEILIYYYQNKIREIEEKLKKNGK